MALRAAVISMLSAILLCSAAHAADDASEVFGQYPLRFAVIGDRTGGHQLGVYGQIVEEIQRMKPDFVLSVGDMIEGYTADTVRVKDEWEEYLQLIQRCTMPVYLSPGNHDIWDDAALPLYLRYIGAPYYSFDVRGVHFIVLDTGRYGTVEQFPNEQLAWLSDDLMTHSNALYTVVVSHIPYWIRTTAAGEPDTLHALFVEHGVDAVFTGHYHEYFSGEYDGVRYTGVGSSGGSCDPGPTGLTYHFMWVTIDGDGISMVPIKKDAVLPWEEVTAPEFIFVENCDDSALVITKPDVAEDLTVPSAGIAVALRNLNRELAVSDTLVWDVPEGWNVSPETLQVEIDPSGTLTTGFVVACGGPLYPMPTLSLKYPYGEDREFLLEQALQVSRTASAHRAAEPPEIDGRIDEDAWKDPVTKGFAPDGTPSATDPTRFYFAWDESTLYLAAWCAESSMDSATYAVLDHDGPVYAEDCVGYFLQPQTSDGPAFQIYFNPLGTAFDQNITIVNGEGVAADGGWNGTYEVGTSREEDHWAIEVGIPLDQIGGRGEAGGTWALNFRRKQHRLGTSVDWLVPISYNPRDYGVLVLRE